MRSPFIWYLKRNKEKCQYFAFWSGVWALLALSIYAHVLINEAGGLIALTGWGNG